MLPLLSLDLVATFRELYVCLLGAFYVAWNLLLAARLTGGLAPQNSSVSGLCNILFLALCCYLNPLFPLHGSWLFWSSLSVNPFLGGIAFRLLDYMATSYVAITAIAIAMFCLFSFLVLQDLVLLNFFSCWLILVCLVFVFFRRFFFLLYLFFFPPFPRFQFVFILFLLLCSFSLYHQFPFFLVIILYFFLLVCRLPMVIVMFFVNLFGLLLCLFFHLDLPLCLLPLLDFIFCFCRGPAIVLFPSPDAFFHASALLLPFLLDSFLSPLVLRIPTCPFLSVLWLRRRCRCAAT
mmetsp:Transcript_29642/g.58206  ORF Transcript_29642/g.58206 Transcript_29642/m.58206 type:complete len:292 (-) Transcript_29642:140-1015(-)